MAVRQGSHSDHQFHPTTHTGPPRIKVPYSKNPVFVAEGYKPPVVAGRSFEYETTPENVEYWQTLSLAYRQYLKKEADTRMIDIRLLIDERRTGAFRCVGCYKPMVMRELFANGDRVYQCLNGDCVKRIIRYQYQAHTGRIAEVA
ncbi:MAG TPA: hypothetical protein VE955_02510 [Candidatus Dormibacteraeota bacterium]|nr:hypothetical protein [Candidatus Dormibacteraeota bacterium]